MAIKGDQSFTTGEAREIKELLHTIRLSQRNEQKVFRDQLRKKYKFYISDFTTSRDGFTPEDFDNLVKSGAISVTQTD